MLIAILNNKFVVLFATIFSTLLFPITRNRRCEKKAHSRSNSPGGSTDSALWRILKQPTTGSSGPGAKSDVYDCLVCACSRFALSPESRSIHNSQLLTSVVYLSDVRGLFLSLFIDLQQHNFDVVSVIILGSIGAAVRPPASL